MGAEMARGGPFVLLANVKVHRHLLQEHEEWARRVQGFIKISEPGTLYHSLDQDPSDPCKLTWTEIYLNEDALLFHFENPVENRYTDKFYDGGLSIHDSINRYTGKFQMK